MFHDNHHPSFPLVKPVRKFPIAFCVTILLATATAIDVQAQVTSRTRSVRRSEQVARANWQPTRPRTAESLRQAPENDLRPTEAFGLVRMAQGEGEVIPLPEPESTGSIVESNPSVIVPTPEVIHGHVLDGQVQMSPLYNDGSCDALPMGDCGCGNNSCDGCDGGIGCNSCGEFCGGTCCGELCSPDAWRPCITLCVPQDGWISYEALGWFQDGLYLPPLVTTSLDPSVSREEAGVLTSPTTRILYGNDEVLTSGMDGGRLRFGVWLDRCHTWGLGAELIGFRSASDRFSAISAGEPILTRPIFNTQLGREDGELVAFPDVVSGEVAVNVSSEFQAGGFHIRRLRRTEEGCGKWMFCGCPEEFCSRTELLFGYRYLQLSESIVVSENLVSTDTQNPGAFEIMDSFRTKNQFNGIDVGWLYRHTRGYWTMDSSVRLAIGNTMQTVSIAGDAKITDPSSTPSTNSYEGGLLALESNIGEYSQNEFAVVPELSINFGYQATDHLRLTAGYTWIYWSNVVRPGHQISRDINPSLLPPVEEPLVGADRPGFAFDTTDYWIQGVNLGGEYRW